MAVTAQKQLPVHEQPATCAGESSELSAKTVLGMVTAVLGFCMYSNVKLWSSAATPEAKLRVKVSMLPGCAQLQAR